MKLKKYELLIVYDPETGEIIHLSEYHDTPEGYTVEIDGDIYCISDEMGEYLSSKTDSNILGLS
jgi:hypothetical protein